jgi:iron complex outermembrane receptor protein
MGWMVLKRRLSWLPVMFGPIFASLAQHASDNPITTADDAFGLVMNTESTGIYSPTSVRGFSPQVARNVRIDGLYFDQQGILSNRVVESSTIRVGINAIGYAFPAPTGIVDYDLRHATNGEPTSTVIVDAGPYATRSVSVDASLPLDSKRLQLPIGAAYEIGAPANAANLGYRSTVANVAAAPQWSPNDHLTIRVFADWQNTTHAETFPIVFTGGVWQPPRIRPGFHGQNWAEGKFTSENYGGIIKAELIQHWSLAGGIFRSISNSPVSYADLYVNTQLDGLAEHLLVGYPDQRVASTSGEVRLTGRFSSGRWYNDVVFLVRGRDSVARYGGSDVVDTGMAFIDGGVQIPRPDFTYTSPTFDHTRLYSTGIAYQVRSPGLDELALGIQHHQYEKTVVSPDSQQSRLTDNPWRFYGAAAIPLVSHISAYADYTQGFEDSGVAPSSAQNRGAILATTRTWQVDGGLRYSLTSKLNLIAGLFELNKPYFNLDTNEVDRALGIQRASGLELSLAGEMTKNLSVNAGGLLGHVNVTGANLAAEGVGHAAIGQPALQFLVNIDYRLPRFPSLSVDVGVYHSSSVPESTDDRVHQSPVTTFNLGVRYQTRVFGPPATLRVQVQNLTNAYIWNVGLSPGFFQFAPRTGIAYLTIDL